MRKLIQSVLGTTAAIALTLAGAACTRSRAPSSSSSVQTPSPAAERVNPGAGYFGNASDNVNRPSSTPPTGMGGGPTPADDPWNNGGSSMGIEQGGSGTSGSGSTGTDTDMTGGDAGPKNEKGSGSTGGMSK